VLARRAVLIDAAVTALDAGRLLAGAIPHVSQ
jgi:hypothetical protein